MKLREQIAKLIFVDENCSLEMNPVKRALLFKVREKGNAYFTVPPGKTEIRAVAELIQEGLVEDATDLANRCIFTITAKGIAVADRMRRAR